MPPLPRSRQFPLTVPAKEFLTFLRCIERAVKKPGDIHLVLDHYAPNMSPQVRAWLEKRARFKLGRWQDTR